MTFLEELATCTELEKYLGQREIKIIKQASKRRPITIFIPQNDALKEYALYVENPPIADALRELIILKRKKYEKRDIDKLGKVGIIPITHDEGNNILIGNATLIEGIAIDRDEGIGYFISKLPDPSLYT